MKKFLFSTRDIAYIGIFLALFIIFKFIEKTIPDLPNGLGNISKIDEIFLMLLALLFKPKNIFTMVLIYFLIFASIFSGYFLSGIYYVQNNWNRFFVFVLDYFIPYILIIMISFFNHKKTIITILISFMFIIFSLISHTISGYIFFREYIIEAKPEFENYPLFIWLWSFVLNAFGYIVLLILIIPLNFIAKIIRKYLVIKE